MPINLVLGPSNIFPIPIRYIEFKSTFFSSNMKAKFSPKLEALFDSLEQKLEEINEETRQKQLKLLSDSTSPSNVHDTYASLSSSTYKTNNTAESSQNELKKDKREKDIFFMFGDGPLGGELGKSMILT